VATYYHNEFVDTFKKLGISFDLFTHTNTANHAEVTQDFFLTLLNKGYIYQDTVLQARPKCRRFLTDLYEGTALSVNSARGDQCDQCGKHESRGSEVPAAVCAVKHRNLKIRNISF
jgi:methionyl-tRNA synthetase